MLGTNYTTRANDTRHYLDRTDLQALQNKIDIFQHVIKYKRVYATRFGYYYLAFSENRDGINLLTFFFTREKREK